MKRKQKKKRVGIIGCGAIGSRIAIAVKKQLSAQCKLSGLYDIDSSIAKNISSQLGQPKLAKTSLKGVINQSDLIVEAVSSDVICDIVKQTLEAKKDILIMSVGKLLKHPQLIDMAKEKKCQMIFPSGAICGCDAIKAASLCHIKQVTLTTRKPTSGIAQNEYCTRRNIKLNKIKKETLIFEGKVRKAVKYFPQNINVAATLALACGQTEKIKIRILTSPHFKKNSHEIHVTGDFGEIKSKTENIACPDNPKTSFLAVLSGIQALKQYFGFIKIGT